MVFIYIVLIIVFLNMCLYFSILNYYNAVIEECIAM
jgi:hypothetical protein